MCLFLRLFPQLKEDLAGQEVEDEGHEEEEEQPEESHSAQTHMFEEQHRCVKHSNPQKDGALLFYASLTFCFVPQRSGR